MLTFSTPANVQTQIMDGEIWMSYFHSYQVSFLFRVPPLVRRLSAWKFIHPRGVCYLITGCDTVVCLRLHLSSRVATPQEMSSPRRASKSKYL